MDIKTPPGCQDSLKITHRQGIFLTKMNLYSMFIYEQKTLFHFVLANGVPMNFKGSDKSYRSAPLWNVCVLFELASVMCAKTYT